MQRLLVLSAIGLCSLGCNAKLEPDYVAKYDAYAQGVCKCASELLPTSETIQDPKLGAVQVFAAEPVLERAQNAYNACAGPIEKTYFAMTAPDGTAKGLYEESLSQSDQEQLAILREAADRCAAMAREKLYPP